MKVICGNCGIEFDVDPSTVKVGRGKYCSRKCYDEHREAKTEYEIQYPGCVAIKLASGGAALIDEEDLHIVLGFKWYAAMSSRKFYAFRVRKKGHEKETPQMHRIIMGNPDGEVDHINGNGLDNRKCNLRICTRTENMYNRRPKRGGTSKYKGVWYERHANHGRWRAQIRAGGKAINLGSFHNEEDAAIAYNKAALELHGDFALLNNVDSKA
jgi:hypothetical protein